MFPVARAVLLYMREREDFVCVLKTVCGWTSKNWLLQYACCGLHFIDSAACVLSFDHSPSNYNFGAARAGWAELPETTAGWVTTAQTAADNPDDDGQPPTPGTTTDDPASHHHHRRPRLATITTDVAVPQLTTPASHQHHRRPRLATITTDDPG